MFLFNKKIMNLTGLVAVSGKPGLYKMIGQNKSGFILESLDEQKVKLVVNMATAKLASLDDITVYGEDDDLKLKDILTAITAYKGEVPEVKADGKILRSFFLEVAPSHDVEKVYASDIKKIIGWYHLLKDLPLFKEEETKTADADETDSAEKKEKKAVKVEKPKTVKPNQKEVAAKSKPAGGMKKTSGKNP